MSNLKDELKRTHYASQLGTNELGAKVRIAGWIEDIRPLGAITFVTIRDVSGLAQVVVRKMKGKDEMYELVQKVPRQSAVIVEGVVKESKAKAVKVEVEAEKIHVVSQAVHPLPIDPTGRVGASLDLQLDARALSLRSPTTMAIFKVRHTALQAIRSYLVDEGFIEVNTSKLIGQAAEGGASLFSFGYFDKRAYLAQSPQLYKEQLTLALDRVFEISTYFRAELSHTTRHLNEFTSVDIEMAFADEEDVMSICERMVLKVIEDVKTKNASELQLLDHQIETPTLPFPKLTYSQAVEELNEEGHLIKMGEDLTDLALRRLAKRHKGFYWIVDWPVHLKPFYIEKKDDLSHSFDLQYGHLELASGGMRVSNKEELERRIKEAGLNVEDFSYHLKCFEWGMPPHSGWGLGLDRLLMVLTGRKNIREVVLYPRDRFRLLP